MARHGHRIWRTGKAERLAAPTIHSVRLLTSLEVRSFLSLFPSSFSFYCSMFTAVSVAFQCPSPLSLILSLSSHTLTAAPNTQSQTRARTHQQHLPGESGDSKRGSRSGPNAGTHPRCAQTLPFSFRVASAAPRLSIFSSVSTPVRLVSTHHPGFEAGRVLTLPSASRPSDLRARRAREPTGRVNV